MDGDNGGREGLRRARARWSYFISFVLLTTISLHVEASAKPIPPQPFSPLSDLGRPYRPDFGQIIIGHACMPPSYRKYITYHTSIENRCTLARQPGSICRAGNNVTHKTCTRRAPDTADLHIILYRECGNLAESKYIQNRLTSLNLPCTRNLSYKKKHTFKRSPNPTHARVGSEIKERFRSHCHSLAVVAVRVIHPVGRLDFILFDLVQHLVIDITTARGTISQGQTNNINIDTNIVGVTRGCCCTRGFLSRPTHRLS